MSPAAEGTDQGAACPSGLDAALTYARFGWHVFPLHSMDAGGHCTCGKRDCSSPGKHPRTLNGLNAGTKDEESIREYWRRWPDANVAIVTGRVSGLLVLDIDPRHGGDESLEKLKQLCGGALPETVEALTGGGGRHLLFQHPGREIRCAVAVGDLPGIDVRADRGYIVAPPSVHLSGRRYEWEVSSHPDEVALALLPADLLALVAGDSAGGNGDGRPKKSLEQPVPEGERNATLTSVAGSLRRRGLDQATILSTLSKVNAERCAPPLPQQEVESIAASVSRYEPGGDGPEANGKAKKRRFRHTDLGTAERLVHAHGQDLRYCHPWKSWLVWDDRRWKRDAAAKVTRLAIRTVRSIYRDAAKETDPQRRASLGAHARRSEAAPRIQAMVSLAASLVPVQPEDLDRDPWRLNVMNGTLDLRTGVLRPHEREDLLTLMAPVRYVEGVTHPVWDSFLERMIPDAEQRDFLRRAAGYSLTGDTSEEKLFFIHGEQAAGKSTFTEAIKGTLGDYANTADFETFLRGREKSIRNDVARLAGRRMVLSLEVDEGRRLAEGLVKTLTGGDTVTARFLHQEFFEFRPAFKLWLVANHKPRANAGDGAMWRRVLLVTFPVSLPEAERDPEVKRLLTQDPAVREAILAWAVRGAREWSEHGLGVPGTVRQATAAYREECDELAGFFDDHCEFGPDLEVQTAELREKFDPWCKTNGVRIPDSRGFAAALSTRGCQATKVKGKRGWRGIGLVFGT